MSKKIIQVFLVVLIFGSIFSKFLIKAYSYDYEPLIIDFGTCEPDSRAVFFGLGHLEYEIVGASNKDCVMLYGREIENPVWDGALDVTCVVPIEIGEQSFEVFDMGPDLSAIEDYCFPTP